MHNAISRLHKFSDWAEHINIPKMPQVWTMHAWLRNIKIGMQSQDSENLCNLEIAQILRLYRTYTIESGY